MFNGITDFDVMWYNEIAASVHLDDNNNVTVEKFIMKIACQPFYGGPVDLNRITDFFESRCYARNYACIDKVLECFGLDEYNAWEMVKVNHGLKPCDGMWIRFKGEDLTWEDINVRKF